RYDLLAVGRNRSANHAPVRARDLLLALRFQVRQVERRLHALVREIQHVARASVKTGEQVDSRILSELEQILAIDRLRIDFLEAATALGDKRQLGIERTFLPGRRLED